jgi:hypothetical protein
MVGTPKRSFRNQITIGAQLSCDRMDLCCFQRLMQSKRRKYGWQSLGQHGLARTRRADHDEDIIFKYTIEPSQSHLRNKYTKD